MLTQKIWRENLTENHPGTGNLSRKCHFKKFGHKNCRFLTVYLDIVVEHDWCNKIHRMMDTGIKEHDGFRSWDDFIQVLRICRLCGRFNSVGDSGIAYRCLGVCSIVCGWLGEWARWWMLAITNHYTIYYYYIKYYIIIIRLRNPTALLPLHGCTRVVPKSKN